MRGEQVERHPSRARGPTRYEIVVRSEFDERFAAAFDEMTIRCEGGRTHMVGEVIDQAQLHGLLERTRNLGIELISVTPLVDETPYAAPAEPSEGPSKAVPPTS
jgi:hypothetical protein